MSPSYLQLLSEIKEMNTVFQRPEGMGVHREQEFSYFQEEYQELEVNGIINDSLIETLDALVDIVVFAIWALHKDGMSAGEIDQALHDSSRKGIQIEKIANPVLYSEQCIDLIFTIFTTIITLVWSTRMIGLFHEVYRSNMSKLKDGQPIPGKLPGKFGKNPESYFPPDLKKVLLSKV